MKVLRRALYLGCGVVLLSSCAAPEPIYDDVINGTGPKEVHVAVIHTGTFGEGEKRKCLANMPTRGPKDSQGNGQACNGIGAANGVACGGRGDTIKWVGRGRVTLTSIVFGGSDAHDDISPDDICVQPTKLAGPVPECTLKAPPEACGYAVAYKYRVNYTVPSEDEPCSVDPYIIVNKH